MEATEKFIRDAQEGGWKLGPSYIDALHGPTLHTGDILLDPAAWYAVGKVRRWRSEQSGSVWQGRAKWFRKMHGLIDALAEGKTIEQYLKSIE